MPNLSPHAGSSPGFGASGSDWGSGGGGSGFGSGGSGGGGGGGGANDFELQALATFPQGTLSVAQGRAGTHRWYLSCRNNECPPTQQLERALRAICASHWPGHPDCVPVTVQWGAPDEKANVMGNIQARQLSTKLETFDVYLIVAQYQLLHISDPWPTFGKPTHPFGTVLALHVTGSGEVMEINPLGLNGGPDKKTMVADVHSNSRYMLPHSDYNLICDRIKDIDLCRIMREKHWREREGTVNWEEFLGEKPGTLLFDSWTLNQTFAPDVDNCRRWQLTVTIKGRQVPHSKGPYPDGDNDTPPIYAVGWNHDYTMADNGKLGWKFIRMFDSNHSGGEKTPYGNCGKNYVPRYPYEKFARMFCPRASVCEDAQSPEAECRNYPHIAGDQLASASQAEIESEIAEIQASAAGVAERKAQREEESQ